MSKTCLKEEYKLTNRELDVLIYVTQGYSNSEIANKLNVSVHTIKSYISSLLKKFCVKERVSLAVKTTKYCLLNNVEI